jgi:hypothetical protein
VLFALWRLLSFVHAEVGWPRRPCFVLGCYTLSRVLC